jgi:hypothetical protein
MRLEKAAALVGADQRLLASQVAMSVQGEGTASSNLAWLPERLGRW